MRQVRNRKTAMKVMCIGGAVSFLIIVVVFWLSLLRPALIPTASLPTSRQSRLTDARHADTEAIAPASRRQQAAVEAAARVLRLLDTATAEVTRWQADIEPLLTNDQGKVLAAEDRFVETFIQLYEANRPWHGEDEIAAARARVTRLLVPLEAAFDEDVSGYLPSPEVFQQLDIEAQEARKAIAIYQYPRERLQTLLADATEAEITPVEMTLAAAIADYKARLALAAADTALGIQEKLGTAEITAQSEKAERLAQTRRAAEDQRARLEREELLREIAVISRMVEQEHKKRQRQREKIASQATRTQKPKGSKR